MSHRTRAATATTATTLVVLAGLLTACSEDADAEVGDGPGPAVATAAPTQGAAAVKDLEDINCRRGADGWDFRATVTNRGTGAMTYSVTVSLATKKDGKVLGRKEMSQTVDPGTSADLAADRFYTGGEDDVVCIPSATKATPLG